MAHRFVATTGIGIIFHQNRFGGVLQSALLFPLHDRLAGYFLPQDVFENPAIDLFDPGQRRRRQEHVNLGLFGQAPAEHLLVDPIAASLTGFELFVVFVVEPIRVGLGEEGFTPPLIVLLQNGKLPRLDGPARLAQKRRRIHGPGQNVQHLALAGHEIAGDIASLFLAGFNAEGADFLKRGHEMGCEIVPGDLDAGHRGLFIT